MGVQVGRIRKIFSVAEVKSQAGCLLSRLGNVGEGVCGVRQKKSKGGPVGEKMAEGDTERDDEYEASENGEKGGVHGGLILGGRMNGRQS